MFPITICHIFDCVQIKKIIKFPGFQRTDVLVHVIVTVRRGHNELIIISGVCE